MQLFGHLLQLVMLDVDGVILDLMADFERHLEATARQLHLPTAPIRQYLAAVHRGTRHSFASLPEAIQVWWPMLSQRDTRQFVECFRTLEREHPYPPVPGSLETIHGFRRQQILVALCTTNDRPMLTHRRQAAGVDPRWCAAASTWESGHPKRDPKALHPIFLAIPVPRQHEVYVGDWYLDVDTARGGRVRCITVLSGGIPATCLPTEGHPGGSHHTWRTSETYSAS
jgi:phosphoglycolate phosphatase-like HAD superfamily hydrolase